MARKQKRLGRGLDALLQARPQPGVASAGAREAGVHEAALDELQSGRYQPRREFPDETLRELADSIREQGVVQPLVVRPATGGGAARYEIVAGERRWRAARSAGLATVPVVVRELDDRSALAVALIENLQREDLNPLDQARSLARLASEFELTHEQVAKAIGRSRASVSNLLRLLDLHDDVQALLADGRLDMGHARALLPLDAPRQVALARQCVDKGLSVRKVEENVRAQLEGAPPRGRTARETDLQTRWLQTQMRKELGPDITIRGARDGGYQLHVAFADLPQLQASLQRALELIGQLRDTAGPRARESGR